MVEPLGESRNYRAYLGVKGRSSLCGIAKVRGLSALATARERIKKPA
jgi:hypothetical protein